MFSDPRGAPPAHTYEQYEGEHDFEPAAPFHGQLSYFPSEGELLIFPSWLVHKASGGGTLRFALRLLIHASLA